MRKLLKAISVVGSIILLLTACNGKATTLENIDEPVGAYIEQNISPSSFDSIGLFFNSDGILEYYNSRTWY